MFFNLYLFYRMLVLIAQMLVFHERMEDGASDAKTKVPSYKCMYFVLILGVYLSFFAKNLYLYHVCNVS